MKKLAKLLAFVVAFAMVASIVVMPASAAELTNLVAGKTDLVYVGKVYTDGNGNYSTEQKGDFTTLVQSNTGAESVVPYNAETGEWTVTKLLANDQIARMTTIPGFQVGDYGYVEAKIKYATPLEEGAEDTRNNTIKTSIQGNAGVSGQAVKTNYPKLSDEYQTYSYTFEAKTLGTGNNTNFHLGFGISGTEEVCIKDYVIYKLPKLTATVSNVEVYNLSAKISVAFDGEVASVTASAASNGATAGTAKATATDAGYDVYVSGLAAGTTYDVTITGKNAYGQPATVTQTITTNGPVGQNLSSNVLSVMKGSLTPTSTNLGNGSWTLAYDADGSGALRQNSVKVKGDTKYIVSAYVRDADGVLNGKTTVSFHNGHCCYGVQSQGMITTDNTVGTEWKQFVGYFTNKTYGNAYYATTGEYKGQDKCANHPTYTKNNMIIHVGFNYTTTAAETLEIKDFAVYEVTETTVTATPAATTNVGDSTTVDFVFSNTTDLAASDITLNGAGSVALTKNSNKSYTATLSGLTPASNYVVTANAKDAFFSPVTATAAFATGAYVAPKSNFVSVFDHLAQTNSGTSHTKTNLGNGVWEINKSTAEADKERLTNGVQDTNNTVEKGVYIVSAKVKNIDENPSPYAVVNAFVSVAGNSQHNIMCKQISTPVSIADNEWHTVTSRSAIMATTATCNCTTEKCSKANSIVHFGIGTNTVNLNFQVKDLTLRKAVVLKYDENYYAYTEDNGDGTATLYIAKDGEAATVYVAVATYEGEKMTGISFEKADIAADGSNSATVRISDNAKVMIWDSNMNPLHNTFLGSDI